MSTLEEWTAAVAAELGLAEWVQGRDTRDLVLDMTRDVAHGVARPAAPLTAYLIGLAAGGAADPAAASRELTERVAALARAWAERAGAPTGEPPSPAGAAGPPDAVAGGSVGAGIAPAGGAGAEGAGAGGGEGGGRG